MSNYFIYVGFVAAFLLLFILGTRIARVRAARNQQELYLASQAARQHDGAGLPMPVTSGQVWTPNGFRPAREVYGSGMNGGIGTSGVGVTRVDGATEADNQLPSYGAPSIPVPESIYSPTTARYQPPNSPPPQLPTGAAAPPEYKYEREGGVSGVTPPKYEGETRV